MQFNNFSQVRYSITSSVNGGQHQLVQRQGRLAPRMTTYSELIEKHTDALRRDTPAGSQKQVIRNHRTALRKYLLSLHKSEDSVVGAELTSDFAERLNQHLLHSTLGHRAKSDRRSLLRAWKSTYDALESEAPPPAKRERNCANAGGHLVTQFERELKRALTKAGLSAKSAARKADISMSAVGRWNRGALPNIRSNASVSKLEGVLKLTPGSLLQALESDRNSEQPAQPNTHRRRLRELRGLDFWLKLDELSPEFLEEWTALLAYKTSTHPLDGFKRTQSGSWTLSQRQHSASKFTVLNSTGGSVSHSAEIAWNRTSSYLGFLRTSRAQGGNGQPESAVQTLAWLCVPRALDAYLTFLAERSAGLRHEGHRTFCNFVASMTREKYGYLRQLPALRSKLPESVVDGRSWDAMCDEAHAVVQAWAADATDTSRDPGESIAFFLSQEQPLRPVFDAMRRIRRLADGSEKGSVAQAVLRRDELLLGFFTANPLRVKNVKTLTWRADNSGNVYQNSAGQWRVRLEAREFKNRRNSKRKKRTRYDVAIAKWLAPVLEAYVTRFRPVICKEAPDSGFLFVSSRTGARLNDMGQRVLKLTRRFIPGSGGISPHSFRHLVATVWLTAHPNDFFVVAELLNDSLKVVLDTYAHLKKDVSFAKYEAFVSAIA